MKYSFICVYNDQRQLNDMLLCSLTNINSGRGKTLLIDNSANRYKSCAEAYNKELALHRDELGDVLVFLHQDIAFDDNSFLVRIQQELANEPNQILGFAGMPKEGRTVSNLKYQRTGQFITGRQVQTKTEVCSIDECCFAMTKDLYERLCFDEQTCSHWHLYAVDLCYAANIKIRDKELCVARNNLSQKRWYNRIANRQTFPLDYVEDDPKIS